MMKKELKNPMIGITVFACVVLIALCSAAMAENEDIYTGVQYNVQVKPGRVTYGTHSTVSVPSLSLPVHHSQAPLISGGTVRSYAHHGHATIPARSGSVSGKGLYATSSATVHTVGSGGGASGGGVAASSGASSSRGISYGGGAVASVAMPALAVNSSMMAAPVLATEPSMPRAIGPRRARPDDESGNEGDWSDNDAGDNDWWYKDEDGWRKPYIGETRVDPVLGYSVTWTGSTWVKSSEYDPGVPLGATPWLWIAVLAAGYCAVRVRKTKHTHCSACNAGASLESGEE